MSIKKNPNICNKSIGAGMNQRSAPAFITFRGGRIEKNGINRQQNSS
jgi:hypothetical protein